MFVGAFIWGTDTSETPFHTWKSEEFRDAFHLKISAGQSLLSSNLGSLDILFELKIATALIKLDNHHTAAFNFQHLRSMFFWNSFESRQLQHWAFSWSACPTTWYRASASLLQKWDHITSQKNLCIFSSMFFSEELQTAEYSRSEEYTRLSLISWQGAAEGWRTSAYTPVLHPFQGTHYQQLANTRHKAGQTSHLAQYGRPWNLTSEGMHED